MSGMLCAARTSRGYGCINQARGGPYCPGHDPRNWCGAPTRNGQHCKRVAKDGRCTKHS